MCFISVDQSGHINLIWDQMGSIELSIPLLKLIYLVSKESLDLPFVARTGSVKQLTIMSEILFSCAHLQPVSIISLARRYNNRLLQRASPLDFP